MTSVQLSVGMAVVLLAASCVAQTCPPASTYAVPSPSGGDDRATIQGLITCAINATTPIIIQFPSGQVYPIGTSGGLPTSTLYGSPNKSHLIIAENNYSQFYPAAPYNSNLITIDGNNSTLRFAERKAIGLEVSRCSDLHLKNMVLEYETLPYTQGRIVGIANGGLQVTIQIDPGYPNPVADAYFGGANVGIHMLLYEAAGAEIKKDSEFVWVNNQPATSWVTSVTSATGCSSGCQVGSACIAINFPNASTMAYSGPPTCGDRVALTAFYPPGATDSIAGCVQCPLSTRIHLENVTIRSSPAQGIAFRFCSQVIVESCTIAPEPAIAGRLLSTNADGIFSQDGLTTIGTTSTPFTGESIIVRDCAVERTGDDAIALWGSWGTVCGWNGSSGVLEVSGAGALSLCVGSSNSQVEIFDPTTLTSKGYANVQSLIGGSNCGGTGVGSYATLSAPPANGEVATAPASGDYFATWCALQDNFCVENNTIANIRARGIALSVSHGVIRNNDICSTSLPGIMITPDFHFGHSSFSRNVDVINNRVFYTNASRRQDSTMTSEFGAISAFVEHAGPTWPSGKSHHNIWIHGNTVGYTGLSGIFVSNSKDVSLDSNLVTNTYQGGFTSSVGSAVGIASAVNEALHVQDSANIAVDPVGISLIEWFSSGASGLPQAPMIPTSSSSGVNNTGSISAPATVLRVSHFGFSTWEGFFDVPPFPATYPTYSSASQTWSVTNDGFTLSLTDWYLIQAEMAERVPARMSSLTLNLPANSPVSADLFTRGQMLGTAASQSSIVIAAITNPVAVSIVISQTTTDTMSLSIDYRATGTSTWSSFGATTGVGHYPAFSVQLMTLSAGGVLPAGTYDLRIVATFNTAIPRVILLDDVSVIST